MKDRIARLPIALRAALDAAEERKLRRNAERLEQEARHMLKQREVLMEQREDFIATLSHDLKIPLLGADLIFDLLRTDGFGPLTVEQLEAINALKESNNRMVTLIETMLDVWRYERSPYQLCLETIDVAAVIEQCISDLQMLADRRKLKIIFEREQDFYLIEADRSGVYRVVQNLLDNAIKFSHMEDEIQISLKLARHLIITVKDRGTRISASDQQQLFQKFRRARNGRFSKSSTGLGLYLCKQIVQAHEGEIKCTSRRGRFNF
jgi:signal transduction histidine kinase